MKNIAVVFGGKSVEHDISIITGLQVIDNLQSRFRVVPIYIGRDGRWVTGDKLFLPDSYLEFSTDGVRPCFFVPGSGELRIKGRLRLGRVKIDAVVLALHGVNGEDGTVQGLMELCNLPYTSTGVMGSALTMDKVLCKQIMQANGIETPEFLSFSREIWQADSRKIARQIREKLGFPVMVKPARAGSSIGVSKCCDGKTLVSAVELALCFDNKTIVEKAIERFTEINIACMGLGEKVELSCMEEVIGNHELLNFEDKYLGDEKVSRIVNPPVEDKVKKTIEKLAIQAFIACECAGLVRMDFLVEQGKVWLNEINSIPGSMANYLWKDMTFEQLLNRLLALADEKRQYREKLTFLYQSQALINFNKFSEGKLHKQ